MDPFDLRLWEGFAKAGGTPSSPAITDQVVIDSRRIASKKALFVALEGKMEDGHSYIVQAIHAGAQFILAKKGWHSKEPLGNTTLLLVDNPLKALQQIAGCYRKQMPCQVIAIVGSYGKTMVKDLLKDLLQSPLLPVAASPESFNSQIGVPLSLLTIRKEHKIALIEAGISEKNEMDILSEIIGANFSIVTHIGKKHLPTLGGDLKHVAQEVMKILRPQPKKQWMLLPKDPLAMAHLSRIESDYYFWNEYSDSLPHAKYTSDEYAEKIPYQINFPDGSNFSGHIHSGFYYFLDLLNITTKAAWLLGISSEAISHSLLHYHPEPMRTELWKSPSGTLFINDTYCSDPQSIDKALKYVHGFNQGRAIFLFGGMRGNSPHSAIDYKRIGKAILQAKIELLVLFGSHPFLPLIEEIRRSSSPIEIKQYASYEEALQHLKNFVKQRDTVLVKGERKYSINSLSEVFHDSISTNQCIINLAAIADNIQTIRHKIDFQSRCMIMVKALAYGTDEIIIAKFLETCGIDILGVSYADEAVALRRAGVSQAIFVINAAAYEAEKIVKWEMEIGVSDLSLIQTLSNEAKKQKKIIKVHLHIDTGMNRFGCKPEEALPLAQSILKCPFLELEGIMTHFSCADDPSQDAFTWKQASQFDLVIEELRLHGIHPRWRHAANSSGCLRFHFPQYNMIRIGLAVYGLHSSQATKNALELRLSFSLVSRIVGINFCKQGETISYGRSYSVHKETQKIAVLPIGYFDGLHRNYSGKGSVIIRGRKAPMVGKICMDFMMVDITDIPNAACGDQALIFGEDEHGNFLSPEELASQGDSIVHELITCLGPRIQRLFIFEEAKRQH